MFTSLVAKYLNHDLNQGGLRDNVVGTHKYGLNEAVGTTLETIWAGGGLYPYLTTNTVLTMSSESANDISAGSGAQVVRVVALDSEFNDVTAEYTLQGQTPVTLAACFRIFRCFVKDVGSGGVNAGNIWFGDGTVTTGVPANKRALITAGVGQTQLAIYTIPNGYYGYLYEWGVSAGGGKAVSAHVQTRIYVNGAYESWRVKNNLRFNNVAVIRDLEFPDRLPVGTDIEIQAKVDTGTTPVEAQFKVLLAPETPNSKFGAIT
jgi:hypothetical protein